MQNKYCLPIIRTSKSDVLSIISDNQNNYGFFEVWLDYIEDLDNDFIKNLLDEYEAKLVFVFRRKNLETPEMPEDIRTNLIKMLAAYKCLVDLDVYDQKDDLAKAQNSNLIVSYHNYNQTPEDVALDRIVEDIKSHSPKIVKMSTMCGNATDALRLIRVKRDLIEKDTKHIILGMGEHGKITRVFGALWGNELIFIPENDKDSSAPGQITRAEFDEIMARINK